MWHRAKKVTLSAGQIEVKIDFPLPIIACNLMFEYTDFYENLQVNIFFTNFQISLLCARAVWGYWANCKTPDDCITLAKWWMMLVVSRLQLKPCSAHVAQLLCLPHRVSVPTVVRMSTSATSAGKVHLIKTLANGSTVSFWNLTAFPGIGPLG